jgi:Rad3-related DNA helicase
VAGKQKQKKTIMDYFPNNLTPRIVQSSALQELENRWNDASVFVVNLPVASGKSAIAISISKWQGKASIITPTKLLVDQYTNEYPSLQVLRAKADYFCEFFKCSLSKRPQGKGIPKLCPKTTMCSGCDQYRMDLRKSRVMPYLLSNYYIYLAHTLYRDTLIIDEAHQLIPMLQKMSSKKLWQDKYNYPHWIQNRQDMISWVQDKRNTWNVSGDLNYHKFKEELLSDRPKFLFRRTDERYRGEDKNCLTMTPLDIRDEPPFMWPSQVKKIVLMSATLSRKDIEQLGISDKKIIYIEADSPINSDRRPVSIPSEAQNMSLRNQAENLPKLAEYIQKIATEHSEEKGLIHVTYGLAEKLKPYLQEDSRFLVHNKNNKTNVYNKFRESDKPLVLLASGMYEGIDLPYDAGRWQIIAKIPWPSLGDPAIKFMCNEDPEYYNWECLKTVLQGCGRICRTLDDYGITYVYDSTFKRLYKDSLKSGFIPKWFANSVTFL